MTGERVLITGGGGFVGRPLVEELIRRGYDVHAVGITPQLPRTDMTWHAANLLDEGSRARLVAEVRPASLVHLAWYVEHGKFWTASENTTWMDASISLFREFVRYGGKRAVFAGSCAEYDWERDDDAPIRETDPCRPATLYGRCKYALYQDLMTEAAKSGVSVAWARLFLLFGLGENRQRLLPSAAVALRDGRPFKMSSGKQLRDFCDTRDIAAGLESLLRAQTVVGAVNLASGTGISLRDITLLTARLVGAKQELLEFGALPDRREPPFLVADVTRLRQEIGFAPQVDLNDRLAGVVPDYLR